MLYDIILPILSGIIIVAIIEYFVLLVIDILIEIIIKKWREGKWK